MADIEPITSDYVRIKRKMTTMFMYMSPSTETPADLKAKIHLVTKVPVTDMKLFIDKNGDVALDDSKLLAEQKVENDQELYMIYRAAESDEWEKLEIGESKPAAAATS
mmetsp:Transcript_18665/g.40213  ORF Transcript_18665/g.40213 Transcript_18665/m.40213 type:complete len:108 (+) Transcript_18665:189-512(+)